MVFEAKGGNDDNTVPGEHPGLGLSISELCSALKTKLTMAADPPGKLSIAMISSAEEDLAIAVAMLRRMTNHHISITHRLPPEILAAVASHLGHDKSLILATHVCHYWRSTLHSSPRLWSHIEFNNQERGLVFLERSKSVLVSVSLMGGRNDRPSQMVRESLLAITNRLASLRGMYSSFLDGFLTQPLPSLQNLDVCGFMGPPKEKSTPTLPSVRFLSTIDLPCPMFHVPNLTNFRFELTYFSRVPAGLGDSLLEFLRSCPLLEVVFISYCKRGEDIEFTMGEASTGTVSLPCLRSFTHEVLSRPVDIGLFNRLSLPPTCDVAFVARTRDWLLFDEPWTHTFPTPRNPSFFSDVKLIKTMVHIRNTPATFSVEFLDSKSTRTSFTRISDNYYHSESHFDSTPFMKLLDSLESSGITGSVETLRFEHYPAPPQRESTPMDLTNELLKFGDLKTLALWQCDPVIFLGNPSPPEVWCPSVRKLVICLPPSRRFWEPTEMGVLGLVRSVAVSRRIYGTPLETITMFSRDTEALLRECERGIEELKSCVGSVEVVKLDD